MSPFFFRPITPPQMMPYAYMRPPMVPPVQPPIPPPIQAAAQLPFQQPFQQPFQPPAPTGGITGFLENANALMANAEKFTPYVQQFSPMVKNLPALWRMYKSFKEPSAPKGSPSAANAPVTNQQPPMPATTQREPMQTSPRPSVPKIYQPTWP